jgi:hypothetical protein
LFPFCFDICTSCDQNPIAGRLHFRQQGRRETKPPEIETLLATFPDRDFILIGDSGEADPEIYGDIARRHPDQVRAILIRNVTAERADDSRYVDGAFKELSPNLWLLFDGADVAGAFLAGRM